MGIIKKIWEQATNNFTQDKKYWKNDKSRSNYVHHTWALFEIANTTNAKLIKKIYLWKYYRKISRTRLNVLGIYAQKDLKNSFNLGQIMLIKYVHGMVLK